MKKVLVGMSGGVDSAVAAYLLQKEGYEVCGVTLRTSERESRCCELDDARAVAWKLGIRHYVLNCTDAFSRDVVDPFVSDYLHGLTPNPCVICNRVVKWEKMLYAAKVMQADCVATGHYAHVVKLPNGRFTVKTALHAAKDQTYMLYRLSQEQLASTLMPLGAYSKEEVRRLAREAGLPVAHKADSQEICFVTEGHYADFIEDYAAEKRKGLPDVGAGSAAGDMRFSPLPAGCPAAGSGNAAEDAQSSLLPAPGSGKNAWALPGPGYFVDEAGNRLGVHKGITHYTVGQRKGLGIALGHPVYVKEIRAAANEVVLSEEAALFSDTVLCRDVNFLSIPGMEPGGTLRAKAKIRYHHVAADCALKMQPDGRVLIRFDVPVRAAAPGQSAVFYDAAGCVIGGGIIL